MKSPPRVVAIIAAYNEEDVIAQVIADLIAQGIEVYLIDHASTDGTLDEVERFRGRGLIDVERFSEDGFAWEALLRRKEQLARELDADWFIHADADELRESPWPDRDLASGIAAVDELGYNAIDFEVFNFPPTRDGFHKRDPLREFFQHWEPAAPFDRIQIKCWKKSDAIDLAATGGHEARLPGQRVFPVRFILRHYPIRSQSHGERKVFRERKPRFLDAERGRSWHIQYDGIGEGHSFLRDPRELRLYDAREARSRVWLERGGVEALEAALRDVREAAGRTRDELERLRRALAEKDAHVEALLRSRTWRWSSPARAAWRLFGRQ